MTKSHLLITGANGFIGRNLSEYFSGRYRLFTPSHEELDLLETKAVRRYILKNKINLIIHTANVGGLRDDFNLKDALKANLRMFFNIVRNIDKVEKIIHFGSGAEFDKTGPIVYAMEEDFDKKIPQDDYGFYKYICSKYIESLPHQKIICLRLFGVFGKYENYRVRFISDAIVKNLSHLPIDMKQNVYFDYLYIDDLMKITKYFLKHETKYNVYNIASGKKIDLIRIAKIINKSSPYQSKIVIKKKGLANEYTASNERLLKEMGDFQFTPIKKGVQLLFNWYRKNLGKIDSSHID